jgi:hypothetical protein
MEKIIQIISHDGELYGLSETGLTYIRQGSGEDSRWYFIISNPPYGDPTEDEE